MLSLTVNGPYKMDVNATPDGGMVLVVTDQNNPIPIVIPMTADQALELGNALIADKMKGFRTEKADAIKGLHVVGR